MTKHKKLIEKFIESQRTEELIVMIIMINAVTLFLSCFDYMHTRFGWWLDAIDHCAVAFFSVELLVRLHVKGLRFFKNGWNIFDALVVIISILPHAGYFSALRSLRVLRIIRLIKFFPKMRFLVTSIIHAIPGVVSITAFLALFFFVFSIIAFNSFKDMNSAFFATIGDTMFTMFQLLLNDNWSGIVRPIMEKLPYSYVYFIAYTVIMKFILLNLFFGLIINSMQSAARKENEKAMKILATNIEEAKELEAKLEITLEHKVDMLMDEIKSLKLLINKSP